MPGIKLAYLHVAAKKVETHPRARGERRSSVASPACPWSVSPSIILPSSPVPLAFPLPHNIVVRSRLPVPLARRRSAGTMVPASRRTRTVVSARCRPRGAGRTRPRPSTVSPAAVMLVGVPFLLFSFLCLPFLLLQPLLLFALCLPAFLLFFLRIGICGARSRNRDRDCIRAGCASCDRCARNTWFAASREAPTKRTRSNQHAERVEWESTHRAAANASASCSLIFLISSRFAASSSPLRSR